MQTRRGKRSRSILALGALGFAVGGCGGGGGDSGGNGGGGGGANLQAYTVHWMQPAGPAADGYVLAYGTESGRYDDQVDFPRSAAQELSDGTLNYDVVLDRAQDQYLIMRAYNGDGYSAPSNELRIPRLGAARAAAAPSGAAAAITSSSAAATAEPEASVAAADPGANASQAVSVEPAAVLTADAAARTDEPLRSVDLDGDAEHLAPTQDALSPASAGFALSLWARASPEATGLGTLISLKCGKACGLALAYDAGREPALELLRADPTGQASLVRRIPAARAAGGWWHLALSVDAERELASLYLDGEILGVEPTATLPPELIRGGPFRVELGAGAFQATRGWRGRLGHAAWWERALDAAEIEALALGGHELDLRVPPYVGALAPIHYWRLGADSSAVGRDFAAGTLPLDDPLGGVDAADIALDAPLARTAEEDPSGQ